MDVYVQQALPIEKTNYTPSAYTSDEFANVLIRRYFCDEQKVNLFKSVIDSQKLCHYMCCYSVDTSTAIHKLCNLEKIPTHSCLCFRICPMGQISDPISQGCFTQHSAWHRNKYSIHIILIHFIHYFKSVAHIRYGASPVVRQ